MFQARLADGSVFKKLVDVVKELVKNCNLDVSPGGISMQAMDTSHVALVSLLLKESGFNFYNSRRNMTLGLSLENLSKILRSGMSEDALILMCEDEQPTSIKISAEANNRISEFNLKLMNLQVQALGIPDTNYSSIVTMSAHQFARICKEEVTHQQVIIETTKEYMKISVQGEIGNGNTIYRAREGSDSQAINLQVDRPVTLSFAAKYLNIFNRASTISSGMRVTLSMQADTPLLMQFELPKNIGNLKFYLAPKIEQDAQ